MLAKISRKVKGREKGSGNGGGGGGGRKKSCE